MPKEDNDDRLVMTSKDAIKMLDEAFGNDQRYEWKDVEDHIKLFKLEGNREAGDWLIKAFHNFITKYCQLIHFGKIPQNKSKDAKTKIDPSVSAFIRMFERKEDRDECPERGKRFVMVVGRIVSLFSAYEYVDIYNELILAFMSMIGKYKVLKEGDRYYTETGNFPRYMQKCFHFSAYKYLSELIEDPLAHNGYLHLIDSYDELKHHDRNDEYEITNDDIMVMNGKAAESFKRAMIRADASLRIMLSDKVKLKDSHADPFDDDFLDFNWTNGITCGEVFSKLTNIEREIIVLYYVKGLSAEMIGSIFNICHTSICNIRNRAVAKLTAAMNELGVEP